MSAAWPIRSALAGAAGAAAMTLSYALERRIRSGRHGPLDYDDSPLPGEILASVMHLSPPRDPRAPALILRFGYGSALGILHGALRREIAEPWATAAFAGTVMGTTLSLFPLLGGTPPPWPWAADVVATSVGTHAVYVVAVAAVTGPPGRLER